MHRPIFSRAHEESGGGIPQDAFLAVLKVNE